MSQNPDENPMDSKFEFWNELPNEMRLECIKRMDFKTRMQLRATSKQDKLLVESAPKPHFDLFKVDLNVEFGPSVFCKNGVKYAVKLAKYGTAPPEYYKKAYKLVIQLLKFSTADTFVFNMKFESDDAFNFLMDTFDSAPFRFKKVYMNCGKMRMAEYFLKNCNSLEFFSLERCLKNFAETEVLDFINYPKIVTLSTVRMTGVATIESPYQLIKKWIDNDYLELGKTLQVVVRDTDFMDLFAEKFENLPKLMKFCVSVQTTPPNTSLSTFFSTKKCFSSSTSSRSMNKSHLTLIKRVKRQENGRWKMAKIILKGTCILAVMDTIVT